MAPRSLRRSLGVVHESLLPDRVHLVGGFVLVAELGSSSRSSLNARSPSWISSVSSSRRLMGALRRNCCSLCSPPSSPQPCPSQRALHPVLQRHRPAMCSVACWYKSAVILLDEWPSRSVTTFNATRAEHERRRRVAHVVQPNAAHPASRTSRSNRWVTPSGCNGSRYVAEHEPLVEMQADREAFFELAGPVRFERRRSPGRAPRHDDSPPLRLRPAHLVPDADERAPPGEPAGVHIYVVHLEPSASPRRSRREQPSRELQGGRRRGSPGTPGLR